jgi:hypothetical protein
MAAGPLLGLGLLRAVLEIGWSENYTATEGFWAWAEAHSTPLAAGAMAAGAMAFWPLGPMRRAGAAVAAGAAIAALYWVAAPEGLRFDWVEYSDGIRRLEASFPGLNPTPEKAMAWFTAGTVAVAATAARRWFLVLLCAPIIYAESAATGGIRYTPWLYWAVLAGWYTGLAGMAVSIWRRTT